jgi:acyl-CoA thioesterase-1
VAVREVRVLMVMMSRLAPQVRVYILLLSLLCAASCAQLRGSVPESGRKVNGHTSPVIYVALGDSTGVGLGARNGGGYVERLLSRIQQARPGARLVNLSHVGATTADVLSHQMARFGETQATLVTISIGMNDLLQGVDEQQFAGNYEEIVSRLREADVSIVMTNLPDVTVAPAISGLDHETLSTRLGLFNRRIKELAGRYGLPLVDLRQKSLSALQSRPDFFSADGLHPSDAGYESWAEAMWPAVKNALD